MEGSDGNNKFQSLEHVAALTPNTFLNLLSFVFSDAAPLNARTKVAANAVKTIESLGGAFFGCTNISAGVELCFACKPRVVPIASCAVFFISNNY